MVNQGELPEYPGENMFPEEVVHALRYEPGFAQRMRAYEAAHTQTLTTVATAAAENEEI